MDGLIPACVKASTYLPLEIYLTLESNRFVSVCIWMCVSSVCSRLLCITSVSLGIKKNAGFSVTE